MARRMRPATGGPGPGARRMASLASALLLALLPFAAKATGLAEGLRDALATNPNWEAAQAQRDAGVEAEVQGRAGLLPQASFSASRSRASTDSTVASLQGPQNSSRDYSAYNYALQLRQPLYRPKAWAAYGQGKAQAAYAEANLQATRQELARQVVLAYAEWGFASAALTAARSQAESLELSASSAARMFNAGDGTRVELETARARLAQARAQVVEADGQVRAARRGWLQITGHGGDLQEAVALPAIGNGASLRLPLDLDTLSQWQQEALAGSAQIQALQHAVRAAQQEVRKSRADHLPSLDLFASRTRSQSDTELTIGNRYDTTRLGLQLSVPIYSGGAVSSVVRQAAANLRRAESELEAARLDLLLRVEREWHAFRAARDAAAASAQAVDAASLAVRAARLGIPAGSATRVDELNAIAEESLARRDLIQADSRALVAWAQLLAAAGRLDEQALQQADAALR
ncbi:TolC family outer membrane protein [Quisquiliibacterium transsilvanicum]